MLQLLGRLLILTLRLHTLHMLFHPCGGQMDHPYLQVYITAVIGLGIIEDWYIFFSVAWFLVC